MAMLMLAFGSPGDRHNSLSLSERQMFAAVGTHFSFCSSFCISTVQHAFPSSLLHGSGWHHVSDHQHAGVQKHMIHTTDSRSRRLMRMLFRKHKHCLAYFRCYGSLGCLKCIVFFFWPPFSFWLEFPRSLCFTAGPVKITCASVCAFSGCAFGNVCTGADKATNSSSTTQASPSFFLKQ